MNLSVGDMVSPNLRQGSHKLLLWSENSYPSVVTCEAAASDVLVVIKIENFDEEGMGGPNAWKNQSCLLLGQDGRMGWTGVDWVKKLPTGA